MAEKRGDYIEVQTAHMCVCKAPVQLATKELGSCVCVMLWDQQSQIGGMIDIVRAYAKGNKKFSDVAQYADTGIVELVRRMELQGAEQEHMQAKIVGGAKIKELEHVSKVSLMGLDTVKAVRQVLQDLNIIIVAEDVGQDIKRTVYFESDTGKCIVSAAGKVTKEI